MNKRFHIQSFKMQGLVALEFTVLAAVFFLVLFAMIGFARAVYIYNATSQATRLGARVAVVCDKDSAAIKSKMIASVPGLTTGNITVAYAPIGCDANSSANSSNKICSSVTVSITGFNVVIATPSSYPLNSLVVPSFSTTLIRESMSSANNSLCT